DRRVRGLAPAQHRGRLLRRGDARAGATARAGGARHGRGTAATRCRGRAVPRLAQPARGRGARRAGVPRGGGLPARARADRRARRAERADHDRGRLRRAASRGPRAASLPSRRAAARRGLDARGRGGSLRPAAGGPPAGRCPAVRARTGRDGVAAFGGEAVGAPRYHSPMDAPKLELDGTQTALPEKFAREGLTFDDVLLVPAASSVLPNDVSTAARLTRTIVLEIPIVSAAMDTVTESRLAIALAREGGIGIVHRNLSIDAQAAEIDRVKRSEAGMIGEPVTLQPDALVSDA